MYHRSQKDLHDNFIIYFSYVKAKDFFPPKQIKIYQNI